MANEHFPAIARSPSSDAGAEHSRKLKAVNEKLREVIDSLRQERDRHLRSQAGSTIRALASTGAGSGDALEMELVQAREALDRQRANEELLRQRLAEIERENRRLCDEFAAVEEHSCAMASLYVALERLHGTLERSEVISAIGEIVVGLIGSEELALYELDAEGQLTLVFAMGDVAHPARVSAGQGVIGRVVAERRLFRASGLSPGNEPPLTACIPLTAGSRVWGALAIYRLLGHRRALGETEHRLLELLGSHAGCALRAAALHARHLEETT